MSIKFLRNLKLARRLTGFTGNKKKIADKFDDFDAHPPGRDSKFRRNSFFLAKNNINQFSEQEPPLGVSRVFNKFGRIIF